MSVGTTFNWVNQSTNAQNTVDTASTAPLFMAVSSFPKGPEDLRIVDGTNFNTLYGSSFDFKTYGQPAIQIQRIINQGGRVLLRRICSADATYSNLRFMALVEEETANKMRDGKKVYVVVATGVEITEDERDQEHLTDDTYKAVTYKVANITFSAATTESVTDLQTLENTEAAYTDGGKTYYNLFTVADIGRGNSGKRVRISNSSAESRSLGYAVYAIEDIESSVSIEKRKFTLNPSVIYNNKPLALSTVESDQFNLGFCDAGYKAFITKLVEITGLEQEYIESQDLLFGKTYKELDMDQIKVTAESVDFSYDYGLELKSAVDGEDFDFGSTAYNAATKAFFGGELTEDIYNVDVYKIDAVVDANYDSVTKEKIAELANFRKDFFYFRDFGTGINSYDDIVEYVSHITYSKFIGNYCTAYDVPDPTTKKPITVTMMYSMVDNIISHLNNGRHLSFAGFAITDLIRGTVKFMPKITPTVNQKDLLEELKVNYATYVDYNSFIVETMFTSTDVDRQLNYIQNVLAVQQVVKDIRTFCPKNRYSFNYTPDFTEYAKSIRESVIEPHMTKFNSLSFEYTADEDQVEAGQFEASLIFSFNAHIQSETFNIYAMD